MAEIPTHQKHDFALRDLTLRELAVRDANSAFGTVLHPEGVVLLLQGPVGPFFAMLQKQLEDNGFKTCRVTFNAADRYYAGRLTRANFKDEPAKFSKWLEEFSTQSKIATVILFGSMRPHHQAARQYFKEAGIPVISLEEGYLRPGYITAELNGNNSYSPVAGNLPLKKIPKLNVPQATSHRSSFNQMAWYAAWYYIAHGLFSSIRERRGFHKRNRANIVREALFWVRNYYRKQKYSLANMRLTERLLETYDKKYFLIPFQVSDDAQLTSSAGKGWSNDKMATSIIHSFANYAPSDMRLVFKIHPLERGHANTRKQVTDIAALYGPEVARRIDVIDTGSIGLLTRHSAGMITVNSTSGFWAFIHGVPLGVLGQAVYSNPKLCSILETESDINRFWGAEKVAKSETRQAYLNFIRVNCLLPGDFYLPDEQDAACAGIVKVVAQMTATAEA